MFSADLHHMAVAVLNALRDRGLTVATAESCTGGLICGLLTEIAGSSDVVERGFVTYSNTAKIEMLGVPAPLIAAHGAVSAEVAAAMADGVLRHSPADVALSVTGVAGPGGGSLDKPVGLVFFAARHRGGAALDERCTFGPIGRHAIRMEAVRTALQLINKVVA